MQCLKCHFGSFIAKRQPSLCLYKEGKKRGETLKLIPWHDSDISVCNTDWSWCNPCTLLLPCSSSHCNIDRAVLCGSLDVCIVWLVKKIQWGKKIPSFWTVCSRSEDNQTEQHPQGFGAERLWRDFKKPHRANKLAAHVAKKSDLSFSEHHTQKVCLIVLFFSVWRNVKRNIFFEQSIRRVGLGCSLIFNV